MNEVSQYISSKSGRTRVMLQRLHSILVEEIGLTDKIRYKIPFYYHKSWICYLNPIKGDKVELVFLWGQQLSNEQGLLQPTERKMVKGVIFDSVADIPDDTVREVIFEAMMLDEEKKK